MALRVKTFRISDTASEEAFNQFIENKIVRHWGTSYAGDPSLGHWNVLIAFEDRLDDRRERDPRGRNDHGRPENGRNESDRNRGERGAPQRRDVREARPPREKPPRPELVVDVPEADMPLYEAMRKWRNARAKEHDIKPYMFFNNKQLESLIKAKPTTKEALRTVLNEMDAERFEKYQDELIGFMSGAHVGNSAAPPGESAQSATE